MLEKIIDLESDFPISLIGIKNLSNPLSLLGQSISISDGIATHFSIDAANSLIAGATIDFDVIALDSANHTATSYAGTVHFTSVDNQASLPVNATLTNGFGTFSAILKTVGSQNIIATDTTTSSIAGTKSSITISPAAAATLAITVPATATYGASFNLTITALDAYSNVATGYAGTIHFTSTDVSATLPSNSTLTSGTRTFSATLITAGSQTITANDVTTISITVTSSGITVSTTESFNWFDVNDDTPDPFQTVDFSLEELLNGSRNTDFTGTVTFSKLSGTLLGSSVTLYSWNGVGWDSLGALPANYTFTGGEENPGMQLFQVVFESVGTIVLRATNGSIIGDSPTFTIGS